LNRDAKLTSEPLYRRRRVRAHTNDRETLCTGKRGWGCPHQLVNYGIDQWSVTGKTSKKSPRVTMGEKRGCGGKGGGLSGWVGRRETVWLTKCLPLTEPKNSSTEKGVVDW